MPYNSEVVIVNLFYCRLANDHKYTRNVTWALNILVD